ncbi:MAG: hypothetical protein WCG01_02750 [bacterium]
MKFKHFLFLLILVFTLSGCTIWSDEKAGSNTVPVLLAQECGLDGLKCCATSPSCNYGQACCVNPNNTNENMCADKCDFGKLEQFCRSDSQCDQGLKCINGTCNLCGTEGETCCHGDNDQERCFGRIKEGNLVCVDDKCLKCGQAGNPCCAENKCFNQNQLLGGHVECRQGACVACGLDGQATCNNDKKCGENYLINDGSCLSCGQYNKPCCKNEQGLEFCDSKLKLKCQLGFCN